MKRLLVIILFCGLPLFCQSNSGELRIKVIDPAGLGVKTAVQIVSQANEYHNALVTNEQGLLDVQRLPYGLYQLQIKQPGFAEVSKALDVHSSIPAEITIQLVLGAVN